MQESILPRTGQTDREITEYLLPRHRSAVNLDQGIAPSNIQNRERESYHNDIIPYSQVWRAKKAIINEIQGDLSEPFSPNTNW